MTLTVNFYRRDFSQPIDTCLIMEPLSLTWSAFGGPQIAEIKLQGNLPNLMKALSLLCSPVMISDVQASPVWWGYVSKIRLIDNNVSFTTSLEDLFNRVRVDYSTISPDNKLADQYSTPVADNSRSQAEYGIREKILYREDIDEDFAEQLRDTFLNSHGWPKTILSRQDNHEDCYVILSCSGWFSTLGWQHYESDNGFAANYGPGPGVFPFNYHSDEIMPGQRFTASGSAALKDVYFMLMRYGSPSGNLYVRLYSDSGGTPNSLLATSAAVVGTTLDSDSHTWTKFTFSSPYTLSDGVDYWIVLYYSGTSHSDYFSLRIDENRNFPGHLGKYYDLSTWQPFPNTNSNWGSPDAYFRAVCVQDTGTQLLDIATAGNQFFHRIEVLETGITASPYRMNGQTCLAEIEDLMQLGTSNNRLVLAKVTPERILKFYEQPDPNVPTVLMDQNRSFITSRGRILSSYMPPIGQWAGFSGTNWVDAPWDKHRLPLCFIERVRLDCLTGKVVINE